MIRLAVHERIYRVESGYFARHLDIYGQQGEACPRCGTAIRRDAFMNRSSYRCPGCQPRPRRARW